MCQLQRNKSAGLEARALRGTFLVVWRLRLNFHRRGHRFNPWTGK